MSDDELDAPEWDIRSLADAYLPRPPTEYIVEKFFATETLNIIYGAPGNMKSMLLADMCAHIAGGTDWLPGIIGNGGQGIAVQQAPVFWLDLDNGRRRTDERFEAVGRQHGLAVDAPLYYVSLPTNPPFAANDIEAIWALRDYVMSYGARLVVIDNLSLITGSVEENSAEMAVIMGNLRALAERTGASFVLIHHQRKGGAAGSRAGDALRGHSSIEASVDLALQVVREPGSLEILVRSTKTRGVDVPTVTARFNYEHKQGTNDLALAWFDGIPLVSTDNPVREMVMRVLTDGGAMTKGRLADEVYERLNQQIGINRIRNWITEMIESTGELSIEEGQYNAKIVYPT